MAKKTEKKGGGKLNRTQTVTIRLDPKLRYLTDLAARSQRRTTSGFIEWAIETALKEVGVYSKLTSDSVPLSDIKDSLWDVDEAYRFLKLAIEFPNLLNHHEQVLWHLLAQVIIPSVNHFDEIDDGAKHQFRIYWDELNVAADGDVGDHDKLLKKIVGIM